MQVGFGLDFLIRQNIFDDTKSPLWISRLIQGSGQLVIQTGVTPLFFGKAVVGILKIKKNGAKVVLGVEILLLFNFC